MIMTEAKKRTILWGLIFVSCLPILALLVRPSVSQISSTTLYLSAVTGYIGIVLLLWMYILGAKSVMSLVFHDLAPVLKVHKKLGKWGSLLILLHPLLIAYSYGESLLYGVIPQIGTEFERHVTLGRIAFALLVLTWVLSVYFRKRLGYRPWKYIHYLAYICVPFALLHVPDVGSQYMKYQSVKLYFFLLVLTFLIFTVIRIRSLFNLDKHAYTISGNKKIRDGDYLPWLSPVNSRVAPRRGQYVYLKSGYISEDHPFSMTQYNETNGDLYITYRVFGEYTRYLTTLDEGQKVFVGGPFGSFTKEIDDQPASPVVYIAGGIGITPFVDRILRENGHREQWLFAANRSHESAVFVPTLQPILGAHCVSIYSEGAVSRPGEESGFLTSDIIHRYLTNPDQYHYYICGPPPMMKAVKATLRDMSIAPSQIHIEKFGW